MRKRSEIREKIGKLRLVRNDAQQFEKTEGYVFLCNGAIKALEWTLGYKRQLSWWCFKCAKLHRGLKCPKCGNETERELG